eukprot:comp16006_c0_seq1/m.13451 comp16006_c0_seq1/g.13451  ORF comp16006_c0_seq1/g.13451 comp16006_c0_seq1/m.13451 type:complete len:303 (-) comp16006_c0_seq1:359-1267(-)
MSGMDVSFKACTDQGEPTPALLAAAQAGLSAPQKTECNKARSYQYHPYDPKKKPRATAAGKKRKFGTASTTLSSPATRQKTNTRNTQHYAPPKEEPFSPNYVKVDTPAPTPLVSPLGPSATSLATSYEQLMLQYTQNQLQQQSLLLQQSMILQQLQALRAIDTTGALSECATPTPATPVSLLPSPAPSSPAVDFNTANCTMPFDLFNCSSPLAPLSPLSTPDSEPSTPTTPIEFAFESLSSLPGMTACPRRLSGSSGDSLSLAVTNSGSVDVSLLPLPAPGVYAGVDELFVELNQNMQQNWC